MKAYRPFAKNYDSSLFDVLQAVPLEIMLGLSLPLFVRRNFTWRFEDAAAAALTISFAMEMMRAIAVVVTPLTC